MPSLYSGGSDSKESTCDAGDLGSIPGLGRSPWEGNGYPLPSYFLENSMDRSYSPWRPKELDMTENTFLYSLRISFRTCIQKYSIPPRPFSSLKILLPPLCQCGFSPIRGKPHTKWETQAWGTATNSRSPQHPAIQAPQWVSTTVG